MAITFRVDDVEPAREPPATRTLREHLGDDVLAFGGDPELRVLATKGTHPLLGAVHQAFAEHRPLVLSPDAIWLTIAQGVARHVRLNADTLRGRLVRHEGRQRIEISWPEASFPSEPDAIARLVAQLRGALAERVGDGRARLFTCDFSTSGEVDRTASEIVLLDAFSPYYDYFVACICGIPEITLLGTPDDWRAIRARVDVITELDLGWWTRSLAPIADQLVRASEGAPDVGFFRAIYKPREAYGWDRITGWIARLYPYVGSRGRYDARNPLLEFGLDDELPYEDPMNPGPGIAAHEAPAGGSVIRVHVSADASEARTLALEGGVLAIELDAEQRLVPRAAWALRRADPEMQELVEIIREHHAFVPRGEGDRPIGGRADRIAFYDELREATLFGGALRARPLADATMIEVQRSDDPEDFDYVIRVIDLSDGTFLAAHAEPQGGWVRMRADRLRPPAWAPDEEEHAIARDGGLVEDVLLWQSDERTDQIPIVARSMTEILSRALAAGGIPELPALGVLSPQRRQLPPPFVTSAPKPRRKTSLDGLPLQQGVPLAPSTTFELGGKAAFYLEAADARAIERALRWAEDRGIRVAILGGGSNLIVDDRGFDGLVLAIRNRGVWMRRAGDLVLVNAAAGEPWDELVARTVADGLAGLECLSGIPGRVGATPIQNVGAYGQEVADTICAVRALDRKRGWPTVIPASRCGFRYRDSRFKSEEPERYVVLSVTFALRPGGAPTVRYAELERALEGKPRDVRTVRETVIALRRAKSMVLDPDDPNRRSAGSFFTNPIVDAALADALSARHEGMPRWPQPDGRVKLAAGWLIERAGITKGMRRGNVGVSTKHALALVHHGGGTSAELLAFSEEIRDAVRVRFGVELQREPVLWKGIGGGDR